MSCNSPMCNEPFDRLSARLYVRQACRQDPRLAEAINILLAEARETRTEMDLDAARYKAGDFGKTGGRPTEIDWTIVFAIDAELDPRIRRKTERAAHILKRMRADGIAARPNVDDLRKRLPTRPEK